MSNKTCRTLPLNLNSGLNVAVFQGFEIDRQADRQIGKWAIRWAPLLENAFGEITTLKY